MNYPGSRVCPLLTQMEHLQSLERVSSFSTRSFCGFGRPTRFDGNDSSDQSRLSSGLFATEIMSGAEVPSRVMCSRGTSVVIDDHWSAGIEHQCCHSTLVDTATRSWCLRSFIVRSTFRGPIFCVNDMHVSCKPRLAISCTKASGNRDYLSPS